MKYTVILEGDAKRGFSAFSPDVPGVYATGATAKVTRERVESGIAYHIRKVRESGGQVPQPRVKAFVLNIQV